MRRQSGRGRRAGNFAGAGLAGFVLGGALALTAGTPGRAQDTAGKPAPPIVQSGQSDLQDPVSRAAVAAGEPPLQVILDGQGYAINTVTDEIPAQRFVKAGRGPVTLRPIAAYGLNTPMKVAGMGDNVVPDCTGGWYPAVKFDPASSSPPRPDKRPLWRVDALHNKQPFPPIHRGGRVTFDPGKAEFGLWVSSAGFRDETVCTEDALQVFVPRFPASDRHKAHVYLAKRDGKILANTYVIGWEYSTNNDNQDIVTLVSNVRPAP